MRNTCCLILLYICINCTAQDIAKSPSVERFAVYASFTPSFFYLEPGVTIDYYLNYNVITEFTYTYLPYQFSVSDGGILDITNQSYAGYGSAFRLGIKIVSVSRKNYRPFSNQIRLSYKDIYYPLYSVPDGDESSDYTLWYNKTEIRHTYFINYVFTEQLNRSEKFKVNYFVSVGYAWGTSQITTIGYSSHQTSPFFSNVGPYGPPQYTETNISRPSFGIGFNFSYLLFTK